MKISNKYFVCWTIVIFILSHLFLYANNDENSPTNTKFQGDTAPQIFGGESRAVDPIIKSLLSSENKIDSVIYVVSGQTYKESFTYNNEIKLLTVHKQKYVGVWEDYSFFTNTYDANQNLLTELEESWDKATASWIGVTLKTSVYDLNDNRLTYLYESWDDIAEDWINNRLYTTTYDEFGNRQSYKLEKWNTSSQTWQEDWLLTFTHDENGNLLTQTWDYSLVTWKDWRYTFTYDESGKRLTYLQEIREPNKTEWINFTRYLYSYDTNENLILDESEVWNIYTLDWYKSTRWTFTYDVLNNLISDLSETPIINTDLWQGSYRSFYTYNDVALETTFTEKWDIIDSSWVDYSRSGYSYDDNGDFTGFYNEVKSGFGWDPDNKTVEFENNGIPYSYICEELSAYYGLLTSIDNILDTNPKIFTLFQNYPNPFNPITTITYQVGTVNSHSPLHVDLNIYSVLGKKVATLVSEKQNSGSYQVSWDASTFSSGIYFYQLNVGDFSKVGKMLLAK